MKPTRWLALLSFSLLVAAAAPKGSHPAPYAAPLPLPPIPPAQPPTDGPAPLPNREAAAPVPVPTDGLTITPRIVRAPNYTEFDQSQGYVAGSRRDEDTSDRRLIPSPGFNLKMPFK
jgi:hypothetical protein